MSTATSWRPGPAWLFCPADRPKRFAKALDVADVVILDLEDAVAHHRKDEARAALLAAVHTIGADTWRDRVVVRINATDSPEHPLDMELVARLPAPRLMVPKAADPATLARLEGHEVIALIESAAGLEALPDLLTPTNVVAAMWGIEDLVASMGGTATRRTDGSYYPIASHVRSRTLVAAKSRGRLALDAVFMQIPDLVGLEDESSEAVDIGFDAKVAIHPSQVPVIRAAFAPTAEAVDRAEAILQRAAAGDGVFTFEGTMVDGPLLAQAELTVERARRASERT